MSDRSAAHCTKHRIYRCSECERDYPDSYHTDWPELVKELKCALATKEMEFKELCQHFDTIKAENARLRETLLDVRGRNKDLLTRAETAEAEACNLRAAQEKE